MYIAWRVGIKRCWNICYDSACFLYVFIRRHCEMYIKCVLEATYLMSVHVRYVYLVWGRIRRPTSEKCISKESKARELKNIFPSRAILRWGGVLGDAMAGGRLGCPGGITFDTVIREDWGKGRGQGPSAKDMPRAEN